MDEYPISLGKVIYVQLRIILLVVSPEYVNTGAWVGEVIAVILASFDKADSP